MVSEEESKFVEGGDFFVNFIDMVIQREETKEGLRTQLLILCGLKRAAISLLLF